MKEYILMYKNALNFSGKSTRREYWMAVLFNCIASALLFVFVLPLMFDFDVACTAYYSVASLYEIIIFVPMLSLTVRRLKDTGKSGWWVLIGLISGIGQIVLFVWLVQPSGFRVKEWYAGYKDNPDKINLEDDNKNQTNNTEYQTAQAVDENNKTINQNEQKTDDTIEKIIADLNEMRKNNQISEQEYNEIMSKLTTKK